MLELTRYSRFDPAIPEEMQAKKSQIHITNTETQEMSTIELRDIVSIKRSNGKELTITKWLHFRGEEREAFEIKVGSCNTLIIDAHLAISIPRLKHTGEACVNLYGADCVNFARGDMKSGEV